jgi:hypothetical protein
MRRLLLVSLLAAFAFTACEQKDRSVAKEAGDKVGQTITDFATGVGKGIDKRLTVNVELSKDLSERGLSVTLGKVSGKRGLSVYLIAQRAFKSRLIAKALDKDGLEIGRSVVDVSFAADDAKYVNFAFQDEMDTQLVAKYVIDIKK